LLFLQLRITLFGYKMAEATFLLSANVFSKLRCRQASPYKFSPNRLIPKKWFENPLPEDPSEEASMGPHIGESFGIDLDAPDLDG
jgi:hypothetical protein